MADIKYIRRAKTKREIVGGVLHMLKNMKDGEKVSVDEITQDPQKRIYILKSVEYLIDNWKKYLKGISVSLSEDYKQIKVLKIDNKK